ncbi:MAG: TIR domain-containing protein, partial [Gemmatimonadota bacterium]|nr:TIR domain-containing protein [Gemmatimonadota bacterium]
MSSIEIADPRVRPPLPGPFISYSRRDLAFARRLYDALLARNRAAWVDLEGIDPSEEWLKKLHSAMDASQAFVFVITEHSVASRHCEDEIRYAAESNKKLIPILLRAVPAERIPETLARIQWISFVEDDRFEENVDELVRALDTDLERTGRHTRLLIRAREWEGGGRDRSFLLRGTDLDEAERWLLDSAPAGEPRPSPLQAEFIGASTRLERRTKSRVLSGVTAAAVVAAVLSVVALYQRNLARENESQAVSRQLAAQAQGTLDSDLPLAMLLAVTAHRRRPTFEARQALIGAMHHRPNLERFLHGQRGRVNQLAFDAEGSLLASAAADGSVIVWDLDTGRPAFTAAERGGGTPAIAINSAARLLATAARSGVIRLWNLRRGEVVDSAGEEPDLRVLAFSPDGRLLAAGTGGGRIAIRDLETGERRCSASASGPAPITALRFDLDGAALGSVDYAGTVRIIDAATCAVIVRSGKEPGGSFAALSTDLSLAVTMDAGFPEIGVIDVRERSVSRQRIEGTSDFLLSADFHPVNGDIALGTQAGEIVLWNPELRRATRTLGGHASDVTAVAFDAGGRKLASASIQGEVILWDLTRTSPIEPVRMMSGAPAANVFFLDAQNLLVVGEDGKAGILDPRTGAVVAEPPPFASKSGLTLAPAGDRFAANRGDAIVIGDLPVGAIVDRITLAGSTDVPPAFSPDGRYLAFADGPKVMLRDLRQGGSVEVGRRDAGSTAMT